jgi:hypothetical protein
MMLLLFQQNPLLRLRRHLLVLCSKLPLLQAPLPLALLVNQILQLSFPAHDNRTRHQVVI